MSKDLYGREKVEDLHAIFRQINTCQRLLREATQAKARYAELVNSMMAPATADEGEQLAEEALKLVTIIENEDQIRKGLWRYEAELLTRYGIRIGAETEEAV